jgi:hypothetical protein
LSILHICQLIQGSALSTWIRESLWAFATIETVHVIAMTTMVGTIAAVDLRLLGLAFRNRPVTDIAQAVLPLTWISFALAASTGPMLFASHAVKYFGNWSFRVKLCLLAMAGANMLIFHLTTYRGVSAWDRAPRPPTAARIAAAISMLTWMGVIVSGRLIGFT